MASVLVSEHVPQHFAPRLKRCTKCRQWLPFDAENFYRAVNQMEGLHSRCKWCCDETTRVRRRLQRAALLWPPYAVWAVYEVLS